MLQALSDTDGYIECAGNFDTSDKSREMVLSREYLDSDEDVQRVGVTGLFYGYFFKWDSQINVDLVKEYGWKPLDKPWPGSFFDFPEFGAFQ